MKTIFKNKKVLIVLGIVLSVAVIAGVTLVAFPAVAEKIYVKVYPRNMAQNSENLTKEERQAINENHLVSADDSPLNEDDYYWINKIKQENEAIYKNQVETLIILEREYGSIENWAPESEFDQRLERTIPKVLELLNGKKLSDEDRATLRLFLQNLRNDGLLSDDVVF